MTPVTFNLGRGDCVVEDVLLCEGRTADGFVYQAIGGGGERVCVCEREMRKVWMAGCRVSDRNKKEPDGKYPCFSVIQGDDERRH